MAGQVRLRGAQETMLGTLWCRVLDARSRRPILGDLAAAEVAARIDHPYQRLGGDPMMVAVTCTRARWIDRRARDFLGRHPDAVVLHLGSGLDTRYERLAPGAGVLWFEVDHPDVVALRREVMPSRPGVEVIGTDVTDLAWLARVPIGRPVLVVAEGLSMYLDPRRATALVAALAQGFRGELIMDFNGRGARIGQFLNTNVRRSGARWTWLVDRPRSLERYGPQLLEESRMVDQLRALGRGQLPAGIRVALGLGQLMPTPRGGVLARYRLAGTA